MRTLLLLEPLSRDCDRRACFRLVWLPARVTNAIALPEHLGKLNFSLSHFLQQLPRGPRERLHVMIELRASVQEFGESIVQGDAIG